MTPNCPSRSSAFLILALACGAASAQVVASGSLADLSLEQLSNIEVTSVSGRAESLKDASASIYVITGDDIRRSAATSLAQALRLAPNLQVAQFNAAGYAVSARGFNNTIGNKLLVLVDGRTVYSSLYSGVFWDTTDVMLEDVERIEVISGPGGTLWGANAVNGVINVITRRAEATPGLLAETLLSDGDRRASARYGGKLGDTGSYRAYAMVLDRSTTFLADGAARPDGSTRRQLGFRADWGRPADGFTLQGDAYQGGKDPASTVAPRIHGGNLLGRWDSHFADGSAFWLQAYADIAERDDDVAFRNDARTLDLALRHEPVVPAGQHLLWGAGYRHTSDANAPGTLVTFMPGTRQLSWTNVFAQHSSELLPALQLTIGAKLEKNVYTGVEFLPSLRLAYQSAGGLTWAALSRAVRAPARLDRDVFVPGTPPFVVLGGPNFHSEVAKVLELGQRGSAGAGLNYSVTLFHQQYAGLRSGTTSSPPPVTLQNGIHGRSSGLEAWGSWQAAHNWRLAAGLLAQRVALTTDSGRPDPASIAALGNDPRQQWQLRSSWDLGASEVDVSVRHVGALPSPAVAAYTAVDARWGWRVGPAFTVALQGQNLFDRRHVEFNARDVASQIERRIFLRLVWQL